MSSDAPRVVLRLRRHLELAVLMLLSTALAVHLLARTREIAASPDTRLGTFPLELDAWRGAELDWDPAVATAVGADDWILRRYGHPTGAFVWLYVGSHGALSFEGGGSPHSPLLCYPGQGWEIVSSSLQEVRNPGGAPLRINKLRVRRGASERLVLYWHQWGDRIAAEEAFGDYGAKLSWLLQVPALIRNGARTDRALVRVSAPIGEDEEATLERQLEFVQVALPHLARHFALDLETR